MNLVGDVMSSRSQPREGATTGTSPDAVSSAEEFENFGQTE
jgi:hypothetical protein